MRAYPTLLLFLTLGGCASAFTSGPPLAVAKNDVSASPDVAKQVCRRERKTGSDLPVTVCGPVQTDAERAIAMDAAQDQIRNENRNRVPGQ